MMQRWWLVLYAVLATSSYTADGAVLVPDTVPAHGTQHAILNVTTIGRYAVTVDNAQGSALQLVDRMHGPEEVQGEAGVRNGRIDALLETGAYKILAMSAEQGRGDARLHVHAFTEQERTPAELVENLPITTTLGDFEQLSYWLRIESEHVVAVEAFGRSLADMRIWRDGSWLVDAVPNIARIEPKSGQPLQVLQLTPRLTPGVYRVTVYGGPALAWSEQAPDQPLVIRYGIAQGAVAARQAFTMDSTGIARLRVPKDATYFRLELAQPGTATLQVEDENVNTPFGAGAGSVGSIDKKSTAPVVDINRSKSSSAAHLVTVTAPAGSRYVLQHFEMSYQYNVAADGDYYLSTVHAGSATDSIDATAVLTRRNVYVDARVVEFDAARGWQRRFNLLDDSTVLLRLPAATRLRVSGSETVATFRMQPFVIFRPREFRTPAWRDSGSVFDLNEGLFELQIHPTQRGILTLTLQAEAAVAAPAPSAVIPAARFGHVHLDTWNTVYSNHQPGVANGIVLRPWPVDLSMPLPVAQGAKEFFDVRVHARGREIPLRVNAGALRPVVEPGDYDVSIDAPGDAARDFALEFIPEAPVKNMMWLTTAQQSLVKFPELTAHTPLFFDLHQHSQATFSVRVAAPALYRLESTGLLDTEGNLRTRTQPTLYRDAAGGAGRNFLIQNFLREGEYQLTVALRGQSAGHLGMQLVHTPMIDAGVLHAGQIARATLPAGQTLRYKFHIQQRATYQLSALGLTREFRVRLDDGEAWPIIAPGSNGNITREFEPGDYQLLVLPEPSAARVVTLLHELREPAINVGHGPHRIALNQAVQHEWREPEGDAPRIADQWDFELPARAKVRVHVDQDMQAVLARGEPGVQDAITTITAAHPWEGELDAGIYRLAAQSVRNNNRVNYVLGVDTNVLLDGMSKAVTTPAMVPVSIGRDGLVELTAFGNQDVHARLYDAHDTLVADNDDGADDWNFHIARWLRRGEYRLAVDPVAVASNTTTVMMKLAPEHDLGTTSFGTDNVIASGGVHTALLTAPESAAALYVGVDSEEVAGLEVEAETADGWKTLAAQLQRAPWLVIPRGGGGAGKRYRVRVWNPNEHATAFYWRAEALTLPLQTEKNLAQGSLAWSQVAKSLVRIARIDVSTPGVFRFDATPAGVWVSDAVHAPVQSVSQANVTVTGTQVWVVQRDVRASANRLKAQRVVLKHAAAENNFQLDIPERRTATLQVSSGSRDAVVIVQAREGLPGVVASEADTVATLAVAQNSALTLINENTSSVRLWNSTVQANALAAELRIVSLQRSERPALGMGVSDGALEAQTLVRLVLPANVRSAHWTLDPGTGVVLRRAQQTLVTLWSGTARYEETLGIAADEAWVFNSSKMQAHYAVELSGARADAKEAQRDFMLSAAQPYQQLFATAGVLRLDFGSDAGRVHVRGADAVTIVDHAGHVQYTPDATVHGPGNVQIRHGTGALIAWLDAPHSPDENTNQLAITLPDSVLLQGVQQTLRIESKHPALIRMRSSTPMLVKSSNAQGATRFDAFPNGANSTLFAPAGVSTLQLQALGAAALTGQLALLETPLLMINEGAGPHFVLGAGDTRGFAFDLAHASDIGIGIRASADTVDAVLYASDGQELGRGLVLMKSLAPGRYYLALSVAERAAPVSLQPVLWGVSRRDTRPPQEIIRQYIESIPQVPLVSSQANPAAATVQESAENTAENNEPEAGSE
ncbi:MAG: hypothetical protein HY273_12970 [Gammaproteobacteria bacterium]|nr:hypothetical protein [Gammaproteobacteria bacterium]